MLHHNAQRSVCRIRDDSWWGSGAAPDTSGCEHPAAPRTPPLEVLRKAWFKDTLQFVVGVWGRRSRPQTPTIGEVWRGLRPLQTSPTVKLIGFELNHAGRPKTALPIFQDRICRLRL